MARRAGWSLALSAAMLAFGGGVSSATAETSSATFVSDDCAAGPLLYASSLENSQLRVNSVTPDAQTLWICVRADAPGVGGYPTGGLHAGGKFVVPWAGATALPTVDNQVTACTTTPGNTVPTQHPILSGAVGDPSEPSTYLPYLLDAYSGAGGVWICVAVGAVGTRVVITPAGGLPPTVTFIPDAPGERAPEPPPPAPTTPSGTCQSSAPHTQYLDVAVPGVARAFLYEDYYDLTQPWPGRDYCLRATAGSAAVGGVLRVDTRSVPTVTTSTTDMSPCTLQVLHNDSPLVDVRRSTGTTTPVSVCVNVAGTPLRLTVDAGPGQPPAIVTWTPDPGTP